MKSRFPVAAFPNGWYRVAGTEEIPIGGVKPLHYFGKDLVLCRTQEGTVQVFEAHCPCNKALPKIQLRSYSVVETNGLIFVYYHAQNAAPTWTLPPLPHWQFPDWTPFQRRAWVIRTHPQEMAENVVDTAHMLHLHGRSFRAIADSKVEINDTVLTHRLRPSYRLAIAGRVGIDTTGTAEISCYGLGMQVSYTRIKAILEFETLALFLLTPIDIEKLEVHVLVSVKRLSYPFITHFLCKQSLAEIRTNLEQDIPIWEHKCYRSQPLLSDVDGPILPYRRWSQQFYTNEVAS
jgi:phenylpropionate dioxygenase-like ring-hydroxylating dioxygenase large terminal subunit